MSLLSKNIAKCWLHRWLPEFEQESNLQIWNNSNPDSIILGKERSRSLKMLFLPPLSSRRKRSYKNRFRQNGNFYLACVVHTGTKTQVERFVRLTKTRNEITTRATKTLRGDPTASVRCRSQLWLPNIFVLYQIAALNIFLSNYVSSQILTASVQFCLDLRKTFLNFRHVSVFLHDCRRVNRMYAWSLERNALTVRYTGLGGKVWTLKTFKGQVLCIASESSYTRKTKQLYRSLTACYPEVIDDIQPPTSSS